MGLVLSRQEGENIILLLESDCDDAAVLEALRHEGITLSITYCPERQGPRPDRGAAGHLYHS